MRFLVAVEKIDAKIEKEITKQKEILKRIRVIEENIAQLQQKSHETDQLIRMHDEMKKQRLQDTQKVIEAQEKEKKRMEKENSLVYLKVIFKKKIVRPVKSVQVVRAVRKKPNMLGARQF